jgi:DNA-binding NtrC family response regulator
MSQKNTILCIDDDALIVKSLKKIFEYDYEVVGCLDPFEALDIIKEQPIKLIICDHRMPKMNGLQFFMKVKEIYPEKMMYKIIYSGYSEMEKDMYKMIQAKVIDEFVTKTCSTEKLFEAVANGIQSLTR